MDTLGGLLDAPRARGAFTLRTVMSSPWSLRILAESPVTLIAGEVGRVGDDIGVIVAHLDTRSGHLSAENCFLHAGNPDRVAAESVSGVAALRWK